MARPLSGASSPMQMAALAGKGKTGKRSEGGGAGQTARRSLLFTTQGSSTPGTLAAVSLRVTESEGTPRLI